MSKPHFTKAPGFLPHHRFRHSIGGPLIRVVATIEKLFPSPDYHNGANHQHLILNNIEVEYSEGLTDGMNVATRIFVAVRFGDNEGLVDPIPFEEGKKTRIQAEGVTTMPQALQNKHFWAVSRKKIGAASSQGST